MISMSKIWATLYAWRLPSLYCYSQVREKSSTAHKFANSKLNPNFQFSLAYDLYAIDQSILRVYHKRSPTVILHPSRFPQAIPNYYYLAHMRTFIPFIHRPKPLVDSNSAEFSQASTKRYCKHIRPATTNVRKELQKEQEFITPFHTLIQ